MKLYAFLEYLKETGYLINSYKDTYFLKMFFNYYKKKHFAFFNDQIVGSQL